MAAGQNAATARQEPAERQHRTETIFHAALATPPGEREALLQRRCGGDTALLAELRGLLQACEAEEAFSACFASTTLHANATGTHSAGRQVGPYELDRLLGRGGMGAVYLAHRVDGQFRQQVAVKLMDAPLATGAFRERFRIERQILAGLAHPYIARLLDGGISHDGEPYLVMEYVNGVAVLRYCEERTLDLRDRLELFRKICTAVQFAHQNLVVHRDLKPDNILIAEDGTPRLLDFGTARLLAPDSASPELTQQGLRAYTPQYASPEQVLGLNITTASDIYSLGVLLYRLIAGVPPYVISDASTAELLRLVCEQAPPSPSAACPATEKPGPDLDAIAMKALRKDPAERYGTVDQLSSDIQAYLSGQPVSARRGTLRYRTGKFVRRNKAGIAAAAMLLIALCAGLAGTLWQAHRATVQRNRAEAQAQDLRLLSRSLLSEIDDAVQQLPGSTPVQRLLVQRVLEHLDRLSITTGDDGQTRLELVTAYTRLGNLQGNPYDQNIGDTTGALASLDKAIAIGQPLLQHRAPDKTVLRELAVATQSRSEVLFGMGRTGEAVVAMRAAIALFQQRLDDNSSADDLAEASAALGGLGDDLGQSGTASLGDNAGALRAFRDALSLSQRALAKDPGHLRSLRALAINHMKAANVLVQTDPAGAIVEYRQSIAAWDSLPAAAKSSYPAQRGRAAAFHKLGLALTEARSYPDALAALEQARATSQTFAAADPADARAQYDLAVDLSDEALTYADMLNPLLNNPGNSSAAAGQPRRAAISLFQQAIAIVQGLISAHPGDVNAHIIQAENRVACGNLMLQTPEAQQGAAMSSTGVAELRKLAARPDASTRILDAASNALLHARPVTLRDPALALRLAQRLDDSTGHTKVGFLTTLAEAYAATGKPELAGATAREALAMLAPQPAGAPPERARLLLEALLHP